MNILKSLLAGLISVSLCTAQTSESDFCIKDADGNVYRAMEIGIQVWTVENLRTTRYNDGVAIPLVTDAGAWNDLTTPGYCFYDNATNADRINEFGALYNWHAVNTKKLAPKGWHVPSDAEWRILQNYLLEQQRNGMPRSYEIFTIPGKVKNSLFESYKNSYPPFPGAGGCRSDFGNFYFIGSNYYWWSATDYGVSSAYSCYILFDSIFLDRNHYGKGSGFSVRLLRDN